MNSLIHKIEGLLGQELCNAQAVGGGCIAQTQLIESKNGERYFLKSGFTNTMFLNEANGLNELRKAKAIRIPEVIAVDKDFLLLEYINGGSKPHSFFQSFGQAFAHLHMHTAKHFGFYEDNFIGSTPQVNKCNKEEQDKWTSFYFNKRLLYQFKLAEQNGYADKNMRSAFRQIENKIDQIMDGSDEVPTLVHGDLWGGNYMVDDQGEPVLIDPAVYYGHREADLAMTKLFGGFSAEFYETYKQCYPLKEGYEYRENIYLLYHVLNHLNLFGLSYQSQAIQLMKSYL